MYALDSNALIYFVKGDAAALSSLSGIFRNIHPLYISAISEVELFGFPNLSLTEAGLLEDALRTVNIIPVDSQIARQAAQLRRICGIKTVDSVIAATAIFSGSTLLTRNIKDFKRIPNLKLQKI